MSLYDEIGGRPTLEKIHKLFYDKVYAHPWIGLYFKEIPQETIEVQQSDFMAQVMGGPAMYCGKLPLAAHKNILITEDLFDLRTSLLVESMQEFGLAPDLQQQWLKIDQAFRKGLVKKNRSECELRFNTDEIIDFPNPDQKAS